MFRIILLAMIAPLVVACQTAPAYVDPAPAAEFGEAITEPTDGIENETADD